ATTAALVPKNPDGSCSGASLEDGGNCVQLVRLDGTCPAGQTMNDGRCFVGCTTDTKTIDWQPPPPAKVIAFTISPKEIDQGSTQPIMLQWVVSNAVTVGIDNGGGNYDSDPTKTAVAGSVTLPPPQASTTWTLLALGVNGQSSDSKTVTLVVKDAAKQYGVAISSPTANAQILDFAVTVSGVIQPVPDP